MRSPAGRGRAPARAAAPAASPATRADPVAERRLTTVLFADLVGFTTISEARDHEEVRELLSGWFTATRTVIERYGGTVEKFIGDAVMAVWGVPTAKEDDAERAVRAGLELIAATQAQADDLGVPGLTMRVGLVTGEVAVTLGATGEGMVAGDAVNTAARVQAAAPPGTVYVDDTTRSLTSAAIAYEDAGEHELKGKARPMRLFAARAVVGSVRGTERVDGLEAPVTGRDREIRLLKELFHTTEETGRPAFVVIEGEAGVGKSRVAWEFEKYIDGLTASVRWHRGRCIAYGDGVAFWALAEAMRGRLGLTESETGDAVVERLDESLERYVPEAEERAWLRPRLAVLLGVATPGAMPREELFAAWAAFLERVGEGHVVVLVVDDAHHADDGLLDFLDHVLGAARFPIFVLGLARTGLMARRPDLAANRRTTLLHLEPLEPAQMERLLDGLVAGLPEEARAVLVERAEGIPLYAVETVRALIDLDLVLPVGGRYVLAEGAAGELAKVSAPASLQALVAARLDSLTPAERRVVADASVLGMTFTQVGIQALAGDVADLDDVLRSLARKQFVSVETDRFSSERGQYRFVQSVVRQVAYDTLSHRDRKARHLTVAAHIAAEEDPGDDNAPVLAQHYLDALKASAESDPDRGELLAQATVMLERAANRAQSLGAPSEALRLMESALALGPDPASAARLHRAACAAANDAAQPARGIEHGTAAVALYEEPRRRLRGRPGRGRDRPLLPRQRRHAAGHRAARDPLGPPGRRSRRRPRGAAADRPAAVGRPPGSRRARRGPPLPGPGAPPGRAHGRPGRVGRRAQRPRAAVHRATGALHGPPAAAGRRRREPPHRLAALDVPRPDEPRPRGAGPRRRSRGRPQPRVAGGRAQVGRGRQQRGRRSQPRPGAVDQRGVGRPRGPRWWRARTSRSIRP